MVGESVSALEVTTLAIASAALLTGIASIGWHVVARRRRFTLEVSGGTGVLLGSEDHALVVIVRAVNTGPVPVDVIGWGFQLRRGRTVVPAEVLPESTPVPSVLAERAEATFFMPMPTFERALEELHASSARGFVLVRPHVVVRAAGRLRPSGLRHANTSPTAHGENRTSPSPLESRTDTGV